MARPTRRPPAAVVQAASALALAAAWATAPAAAAAPPGDAVTSSHAWGARPTDLVLTVSGGVSLGAYEGGFLYYLLRVMQANDLPVRIRLAAGTSAGSVNSLLALLYSCGALPGRPEDSLFYQTWIPLGIDLLFDARQVSATGALSRAWLEEVARRIEARWAAGLGETCDVVWGVATTRLTPRPVNMAHKRLMVPRMEEKFALHIAGRGPGRAPFARNYLDPELGLEQAMVPHDADGNVGFEAIRELVFASAAVPVAFPPQLLHYCHRHPPPGEAHRCLAGDALADPFIDGALFDNTPLRHAARIAAGGLEADANGALLWRQTWRSRPPPMPQQVGFAFLTHEATDYATAAPPGSQPPPAGVVELAERLAATFVATARTKELYTLLEEMPEIRDLIFLPRRHFPTAGGLMNAFLGFFDADFRLFDFTLGMYDARRMFHAEMVADAGARRAGGPAAPPLAFPEDLAEDPAAAPSAAWQRLRCMRGVLDDHDLDAPACRPPAAADRATAERWDNFRILLQVGYERLWDTCAAFDPNLPPTTENPSCRAAMAGDPPPAVAGVRPLPVDAWRRGPHEVPLKHALRLLSTHGFAFRGLGLGPADAHLAEGALREKVWEMGRALVARQPAHDRRSTRLALELGVEAMARGAARREGSIVLGRQLVGAASVALPSSVWPAAGPRLQAGVVLDNLPGVLTSSRGGVALGPVVGVELEPRAALSAVAHLRVGAVGGFMFSTGDRFLSRPCAPRAGQGLGSCSRPLAQLAVGVDLLRHLRVQLTTSLYPPMRAGEELLWAVSPSVGVVWW